MQWHVIHTKVREEFRALENLQAQGFEVFLPTCQVQKKSQGKIKLATEPLFSRYLFIRLGQGPTAQSWTPIRSTKGVSRLVTFGTTPAKVDDALIALLRNQEALVQAEPDRLFKPGERVRITAAPFIDIEGIYQMTDADQRVMVLIELMSKPVKIHLAPSEIQKVG
jgi:transcriptional antiterminator RfaH